MMYQRTERSKTLVGPSKPLEQVYNQLPFVNAPFILQTRNTKMARGMIVPVTVAANTNITITHNLGRQIQGMICVLNGANGELFPPQFALVLPATNNGARQSVVKANGACTSALLWVF